jgi:hypothetical protein
MKDADTLIEEATYRHEEDRQLAQEAADWFLERDGELFERDDAEDAIAEALDIDSEQAGRVLSELVGDIVDPVQQIPHPDARYVGIIDYEEYPDAGAYGYVQYHDRYGERNRVICAKCVEQHSHDSDVSHATGGEGSFYEQPDADWSTLVDRVEDHYSQHDADPASITVGASLVSGTTMGGNQAWHDGNVSSGSNISISNQSISVSPQGSGSGLDADKVDGTEANNLGVTNVNLDSFGWYESSRSTESVQFNISERCVGGTVETKLSFDSQDSFFKIKFQDTVNNTTVTKSFQLTAQTVDGYSTVSTTTEFDRLDMIWDGYANSPYTANGNFDVTLKF